MDTALKSNRKIKILSVAAVIVVAVVLFCLLLVNSIGAVTGGKQRVVMPGESILNLDKAGKYVVYYEYRSMVDGEFFDTDKGLGSFRCSLIEKASGKSIKLSSPSMSSQYSMGSYEGYAISQFEIEKPGKYIISLTGNEIQKSRFVLAVGRSIFAPIVVMVLGIMAIILLTVFAVMFILLKK